MLPYQAFPRQPFRAGIFLILYAESAANGSGVPLLWVESGMLV